MAPEEKPYRVYRGGRRAPRLPTLSRQRRGERPACTPENGPEGRRYGLRGVARCAGWASASRSSSSGLAAWSLAGYFSFRDGVKAANKRLPASAERQLSGQGGVLLTKPTTILLLGTDTRPGKGQQGLRHSDSMMLVRTDPDHHRLYYLSIPRDLWVDIPGYGTDRINTSYQVGGAALAIRTVRNLTGIDIDHVAVVDFKRFKELIDSIGGIDSTSLMPSSPTASNARTTPTGCASWDGWRFAKGRQHMDGRRALVYSRIRENRLDASDNDITRGERQQQVTQAIADKLIGVGTFLRMPVQRGRIAATARDRPLCESAAAARLGEVPRGRRQHDPLPARRRSGDDRRRLGDPLLRGEPQRHLDVPRRVRAAAAEAGTGTFGPGCVVGGRTRSGPARASGLGLLRFLLLRLLVPSPDFAASRCPWSRACVPSCRSRSSRSPCP